MFCMYCGARLTEGAQTCRNCGAKVLIPGKKFGKETGLLECSEKNQLMIRVPGKGLYFIANENRLCFLDDNTGEARVLIKKTGSVNLCGLGYYGGNIYYWHECQNEKTNLYGIRLYEMNPVTQETEVVWESEEELFYHYRLDNSIGKARAILYRGSYYLLNHYEQKLLRVSLPDGAWEETPLPNMRDKMPLLDWMNPRGPVDLKNESPNFGLKYTGLAILDGEVYLSLDGCMVCTLRFPLGYPEKITYLPKNSAVSIQNGELGGMLVSVNGRVFSCPGAVLGTNEICVYEIWQDGNLTRLLSNASGEVNLNNKGGYWWRFGNTVYVGRIAMDLYERKWHKLPYQLFRQNANNVFGDVADYLPGINNTVYLLTDSTLYMVPRDWENRVSQAGDLRQFEVANLKKLI